MDSDAPAPAPAGSPAHEPAARSAGGTILQTLRRLDTSLRGLTDAEAAARLAETAATAATAETGGNVFHGVRTASASWPRLLLRGPRDPFTAVLLGLGLVCALIASWGAAAVILVLVAVSCVLRASGEHRADRSLAALRDLVAGTATVLRRTADGAPPRPCELPVADLVPGDVIRLGPGDLVPADVRLLRARGLTVHQAVLTGESAPVAKTAAEEPPDGPETEAPLCLQERDFCFQGSDVASGSATAVVLATGTRTRFAAALGRPARREASAFDRSVHGITWTLIRFMLLAPPLVLLAGAALDGRGPQTLPFAVTVAVGLTPEMLPVIVTTCLARGAALLARTHGVIVKRMPALHDLGAIDVLCVDKTGTLTQDRPVVERSLGPDGRADPEALHWAGVNAWWTLQLAELPAPDALDEALLEATGTTGEEYEGVDAVPHDPVRRVSTAVLRGPRLGTHLLAVKGAVEDVLDRCALDPDERTRLHAVAVREADTGLRVLAVATGEVPAGRREILTAASDVAPRTRACPQAAGERGLTFRGLVTFRDALAPGAAQALRDLADRGIAVRVLTGDHPGTATRVCRELGLEPVLETVLERGFAPGSEPGEVGPAAGVAADMANRTADRTGDRTAERTGDRTIVHARCTPEDKAGVVAALRAAGHTVGFLGDGVNDAPALRAADVGIAPRSACAVARESADVVLGEKDLGAVAHAVTAGRHSSANIASYLRATLSSNLGNVLAMLAAGLLLPFLPMLPAQVLAQNLCFDAAQLAFAYDRPDAAALRRPTVLRPRAFLRFLTGFGMLNAVADLATFAVLALTLNGPDAIDDRAVFHSAWFTENLLTQAVAMVLLRTVRGGAATSGPVARAAAVLGAVGLLLPPSPIGDRLGMTALPVAYYVLLTAVLALYALALHLGCTVAQRSNHC